MSDDLVKRLRANTSWGDDRFAEAADRIEALAAERDLLRGALDEIAEQDGNHAVDRCDCTPAEMLAEVRAIARAALKGESHDQRA